MLLSYALSAPRPHTIVVGTREGWNTERQGGHRAAQVAALPASLLRVAFRKTFSDKTPLSPVLSADAVTIATGRGDVITLSLEGDERARVSTGCAEPSGLATLSDGTHILACATGEIVGIRDERVRFRREAPASPSRKVTAPLPTEDGGFFATYGRFVTLHDAAGIIRTTTALPSPLAAPVVRCGREVFALTDEGALFAIVPGEDPIRLGVPGGSDGPVACHAGALFFAGTDRTLTKWKLPHGPKSSRTPQDGRVVLGPVAVTHRDIVALSMSPSHVSLSRFSLLDGGERHAELGRTVGAPDAGMVIPLHVGPVADRVGRVAFALPAGRVGVHEGEETRMVGERICLSEPSGLAAHGDHMAVTCTEGALALISGGTQDL